MVSVYVSGQKVSGLVLCRTADTIVVQMVHPDNGILMDASMPEYASRQCDFKGAYGDDVISMLLRDAYELYRYTRENRQQLKGAYRGLLDELAEIDYENMTLNEFEAKRRCKQMLFFYDNYKRYVPRYSWASIVALLGEDLNRDLYLSSLSLWAFLGLRNFLLDPDKAVGCD